MKLLFVTSNLHKIESANENLAKYNVEVESVKVEKIQEIQTERIEEISIDKAKKAYSEVKKPLMVSDAGWSIPALNGFPGPVMSYVGKCFLSNDFLSLMSDKEDKTIKLVECITYINKKGYKVFTNKLNGLFLDHEEGEGGCLDKIVTFRDDKKSVAKCRNEGLLAIDQSNMWKELGEYLNSIE